MTKFTGIPFKKIKLNQNLFLALLCLLIGYNSHAQPKRFQFTENKMASPFTILFYHADSLEAVRIAREGFTIVDSLAAIFTDYEEESELNRFCAKAAPDADFTPLSQPLFDILHQSKNAHKISRGTFDITVGKLSRLWRQARRSGEWPRSEMVAEALDKSGMKYLQVDAKTRSGRLLKKGIQLDLGGIAQGYIADTIMRFLQTRGIENALIDVSGDIITRGHPPGKQAWVVAINTPHHEEEWLHDHLYMNDNAVTTSGDLYQYMEHEGKRYSHIINPSTGYGITTRKSVTVVAKDAIVADWFTKAVSLLPHRKAIRVARKLNAEFLVVELKAEEMKFRYSKKFTTFMKTFAPENADANN